MQDIFKIGLIVKPQGVRGEVKIKPLTDDLTRFNGLKEALIDGKAFKIINARVSNNEVFLTLFGVMDRNAAETLRNKFICVTRENAVTLEEGTFFVADLMGAKVYSDGEVLGTVEDISSAKTDYFTVKTADGRTMRFPFLKDLLIKVDISGGEIYLKKSRLKEVSFYED